jgi:hypothetical protein
VLESVDDVHGGDRVASGVIGVVDGIADDVLEEDLEDASGLLVDEAREALDATTARETADFRLRDAFEVVTPDIATALTTCACDWLVRVGIGVGGLWVRRRGLDARAGHGYHRALVRRSIR